MTDHQVGQLLAELWKDLQDPAVLWQAGVLGACVLLAWAGARLLRWRAPDASADAIKRGAAAYRRIAFPLLAVLLLFAGRAALGRWHNTNLLSVAIPLFGALAGIRFTVYLLRLALPAGSWLEASERMVATLIWAALALHVTGLLPEMVGVLEGLEFNFGRQRITLWGLASSSFWVLATVLLAMWAGSALEGRLMRARQLHSSTRAVFARLGKALLLVASVLVVLPLVGVDLTVLTVFGGALGVGLGLGLQKIASNYLSGFIILLDRSIRIGDMITADNHHGEVRQITTRYVVVRSLGGVEAIIPNDTLVTTTVLNHSYTDRSVRLAVRVPVAYATDVKAVLELLSGIASRQARVLRDPPPAAHVAELADNGIVLELGFWIADPENGSLNVRSAISLQILTEFQARGIQIPVPQREVRLVGGGG